MRKEAGFEVTDRINVYVSASGDALSVLTEKSSDIANGVLAVKVEITDTVNGYVKEWDVAGSKVIIGVEKI